MYVLVILYKNTYGDCSLLNTFVAITYVYTTYTENDILTNHYPILDHLFQIQFKLLSES